MIVGFKRKPVTAEVSCRECRTSALVDTDGTWPLGAVRAVWDRCPDCCGYHDGSWPDGAKLRFYDSAGEEVI